MPEAPVAPVADKKIVINYIVRSEVYDAQLDIDVPHMHHSCHSAAEAIKAAKAAAKELNPQHEPIGLANVMIEMHTPGRREPLLFKPQPPSKFRMKDGKPLDPFYGLLNRERKVLEGKSF